MTQGQWNSFVAFRDEFKALCDKWNSDGKILAGLQEEAARQDTPEYKIENPVVYNSAFDSITRNDDIKIIVIGDNPGKEEQLDAKKSYLVGQSGRIAEGFFRRNPELGVDFRKNAIIMNKTPIHTAKTKHLKFLAKNGGDRIASLIEESQAECARLTSCLHKGLVENSEGEMIPQLWLVGYAELKKKGIFSGYRNELKAAYAGNAAWDKVFVYQHFSMNRFLVDLKAFRESKPELLLPDALAVLGRSHRDEIFSAEK